MIQDGKELTALRAWLVIIALVEAPEVYGYLVQNKPLKAFNSLMKNNRPEKRWWCMILVFLVLSRIQAAAYPHSRGVMEHCAAVHILEAVVFGYEYLVHKSNGSPAIFAVILANAVWFTSVTLR